MKKFFTFFVFIIVLFLAMPFANAQEDNSCIKMIKYNADTKEFEENYYTKYSDEISVYVTDEEREKIDEKLDELDYEIKMLSKLVYREARGEDKKHQAGVIWCVLNRVDSGKYSNSIGSVIKAKHQFAWRPKTPIKNNLYDISKDVVTRWLLEKENKKEVGRVLPSDYYFFAGNGKENKFRKEYRSKNHWNWSLPSPYDDEKHGE